MIKIHKFQREWPLYANNHDHPFAYKRGWFFLGIETTNSVFLLPPWNDWLTNRRFRNANKGIETAPESYVQVLVLK